jgi:O-antigen ligase
MAISKGEQVNLSINLLLLVLAFSIPIYRKWVVICAPLILLLWFFDGRLPDKVEALRRNRLTLAILLFILLNLLSLLWSDNPSSGLSYVAKYRYLLLVPVIATSLRAGFRDRVTTAFLTGSTISVLLSLGVLLRLFRSTTAYHGNPSPTMSHLDYSMVLAIATALIMNRIAHRSMAGSRLALWIGLLLLHLTGLVVNIGRSGQAAFAATVLVMVPWYLARRSRRAAVAGLVAVVVAITSIYLIVPRFRARVDAAISDVTQTVTEHRYRGNLGKRIAGTIVAVEVIRDHPILGTGVGDNMDEFREVLDTRYPQLKDGISWFPHLHNQYLQVASELGLVGLASMLYIFFALLRGPYPRLEEQDLALILCCVFLVGFLGDPFLHKNLPLVLFAALSGLISAEGHSPFWTAGIRNDR